jgi:hypothetical protein
LRFQNETVDVVDRMNADRSLVAFLTRDYEALNLHDNKQ